MCREVAEAGLWKDTGLRHIQAQDDVFSPDYTHLPYMETFNVEPSGGYMTMRDLEMRENSRVPPPLPMSEKVVECGEKSFECGLNLGPEPLIESTVPAPTSG